MYKNKPHVLLKSDRWVNTPEELVVKNFIVKESRGTGSKWFKGTSEKLFRVVQGVGAGTEVRLGEGASWVQQEWRSNEILLVKAVIFVSPVQGGGGTGRVTLLKGHQREIRGLLSGPLL